MNKLTVRDLDASGKRVFVRVDFNVPLEDGKVSDDERVRAALPTIKLLMDKGAKLVLASHLGRPKGKDATQSLLPVAGCLQERLGRDVIFADDCIGDGVKKMAADLNPGQVMLLENLRFHPGEEKNDEGFAKALASYADVYVNDAFGTAHRAHASTEGMIRFVQDFGAGFHMLKEIEFLGKLVGSVQRPADAGLARSEHHPS